MNIVIENWKKVEDDFPNYSVSDQGRVRNDRTGLIRKLYADTDGYLTVGLYGVFSNKLFFVHRLVGAAFLSDFDKALTINHKNGIKTDNRPCNLESMTQAKNVHHAINTGLRMQARKLTQEQAELIRGARQRSITLSFLARWFGVSTTVISRIEKGTRYKRLAA